MLARSSPREKEKGRVGEEEIVMLVRECVIELISISRPNKSVVIELAFVVRHVTVKCTNWHKIMSMVCIRE